MKITGALFAAIGLGLAAGSTPSNLEIVTAPQERAPSRSRRRRRMFEKPRKLMTIHSPPNPKAKNRPKGYPKRTEWMVCEPNDRAAMIAEGMRPVREWREGEPLVTVRHTSSLTPGSFR